MNTGIESEAEQFGWLVSELSSVNGKPVALFLHKPLYLNTPDDPEIESSAIRYVPQPRRKNLIEMFSAIDLRLVASGHVHQRARLHLRPHPPRLGAVRRLRHSGPDAGSDRHQGSRAGGVSFSSPIVLKFRHVRAPGQIRRRAGFAVRQGMIERDEASLRMVVPTLSFCQSVISSNRPDHASDVRAHVTTGRSTMPKEV
jgi:hypothetical protein